MSENGRGRAEQFQRPRPRIQSLSDLILGLAFSTLSQNEPSAVYALDIGAIWAILASFSHILSSEERNLVAPDLLRKYRLFRNLELIVGGLFFVSILPPFWTYAIGGTNLRYVLWLLSFFVRRGGNLYSRAALKQRH